MIKIDNLTKLYKKKKETTCKALDGVSTVLPDKGLVFILGKSGSGKSTLLNLIGGLDSFDGGDIVSYGNSLASFTEADYEAYRSDFVSFIFQDYHLIDELNVLENITLFNSEKVDDELLRETLDTVGMTDYVNRYPNQLSGGQKQRVAIARGIIKDPHVILCDEPTGNLDKHTSYQILELLKKLSKKKLVVIVSHNLTEAETFADRIIELADGRIIVDRARDESYCDDFRIEDGKAILPYRNKMSDEDVESFNDSIKDGTLTEVALNTSGFEPTELEYVENKKELKLRLLGKKNVRRLFKKFFFSKYKIAISTIILSFLMFGLFSIIQAFINFNPNQAILDALDEKRSIVALEREYSSTHLPIYNMPKELEGEKTYPLYNQTIWLSNPYGNSLDNSSRLSDKNNLEGLYIHETYGLLLCDEAYLVNMFGRDGRLTLLAGKLEDATDGAGVLITDYFAESILKHDEALGLERFNTYEDLLCVFNPSGSNTACRIVGVIDTDYEQKYDGLFKEYNKLVEKGVNGRKQLESFISKDPEYIKFMDDVILNLGVSYSLNADYISDFSLEETTLVRTNGLYFKAGENLSYGKNLTYMTTRTEKITPSQFADNEIAIPYTIYNELFGTTYDQDDTNVIDPKFEREITLIRYVDNDSKRSIAYEMTFTVTAITNARVVLNEANMLKIQQLDWRPIKIYVQDISDVGKAVKLTDTGSYRLSSRSQRNVQRVNDLVSTFYDLFRFLEVTCILMIAFFLILFGIRSIKQNSYQIGVIKALGGRNRDIQKIFVIKTFVIGVLIAAVSIATSVFFVKFADKVLIASIEMVLGMNVGTLHVIRFMPKIIFIDGLLMIGMALVSALIPVILLKKIKPVEIIKAKE